MGHRYNDRAYSRQGYGQRSRRASYGGSGFEDEYIGPESEERYFGSGQQNYGEGYADAYPDLISRRAGYTRGGRFGRDFGGTLRPSDRYYRDEPGHYGRYGGEHEEDFTDRYRGRISSGRRRRGDAGYSVYGEYPESERGYMTDPEFYRGEPRGWWDRTADEVASWFGDEGAEKRRQMDERQAGFRGRGPRGYTRSDERIREDINDALTDAWMIDAWDIEESVTDGNVILKGTVENRHEKRLAEDVAEDVSGVKNVENHIHVNPAYTRADQETSSTRTNTAAKTTTTSPGRSKSASA